MSVLESLRHDLQWDDLAGGKFGLADKTQQREVNRALNYVQGKRLQAVMDRALSIIEEDDFAKLKLTLVGTDQGGNPVLNTKPLIELAKATETIHNVIYRASADQLAIEADKVTEDSDRIKNLSLTISNTVNRAVVQNGMQSVDLVKHHKTDINV